MNFLTFKDKFFDLGCFNINQVFAWQPGFDRNNLTRWISKGYLVRLRQGYFAFPEYKKTNHFFYYIANRIYKPSYISIHSALSFYGMIPESVIQITSVTSLKTAFFENDFGEYSYKSIKESLMFGYDLKPMQGDRTLQFATPEKALLDLLYLYPFYNNRMEMEELRLDEDFMHEDLKVGLLMELLDKFENKALAQRVKLLFEVYEL
ncbi:MAG TPA: hypothetical protein VK212_11405 [Lentimicrobium sp.]|nr:hypothetical protein [Lentimicrobium sp.]